LQEHTHSTISFEDYRLKVFGEPIVVDTTGGDATGGGAAEVPGFENLGIGHRVTDDTDLETGSCHGVASPTLA